MDQYRKGVEARREQEIKVLANLTGWDPGDIRPKMKPLPGPSFSDSKSVLASGPKTIFDPSSAKPMSLVTPR